MQRSIIQPEEEWSASPCCNMHKPWKHDAERKKQGTEGHILLNSICMKMSKIGKSTDNKQINSCLGTSRGRNGEWLLNGEGISLGGYNALELDRNDDHTVNMLQSAELHTLKWLIFCDVNFISIKTTKMYTEP